MSKVIVTGIKTGIKPNATVNELPQRLEWQDFIQDPANVTLYVLALQQFMAMDQSKVTAYFQIGGIHGLPFTPWDGVAGVNPTKGYCNHGMNTFPTWHRPYVALYEQLLAGFFPAIVADYAKSNSVAAKQVEKAAPTWRLPYWDWALYPDIPDEWSSGTIRILDKATGHLTPVPNPFAQYTFHPIDSSFAPYKPPSSPDYAQWKTTLRQPNSWSSPNAHTQTAVANQQLKTSDFKALILDLFPSQLFQPDPWGQFASHTWDDIHPGQPTLTSLEGIHDTIHGDIGGNGHMGDPDVAAFDPIFWLHHCNVDRLLDLWQAAYPDVYVSPGPDMTGTFVHNPDTDTNATDINVNTALEPFYKSQSAFATSTDCRSTAAYGYTYPEIAQAGNLPADQLADAIWNTVQNVYGDGSFFTSAFSTPPQQAPENVVSSLLQPFEKLSVKPTVLPTVKANTVSIPAHIAFTALPQAKKAQIPLKPANPPPPSNPHPPPTTTAPAPGEDYVVTPDTYQDWNVNATLEKYALGGSGQICFFLGPTNEIPADPKDWYSSPIFVGKFGIFTNNPDLTGCSNCEDQKLAKTRIGGTVHLTKCLIRHRIPLVGDEPVAYLKENLHWRASTSRNVEVPIADIPSMKVVVQSAGYRLPPGGGIGARPVRLPWRRHSPVTRGRTGGVDHGDDFNN